MILLLIFKHNNIKNMRILTATLIAVGVFKGRQARYEGKLFFFAIGCECETKLSKIQQKIRGQYN